MGRAVLAWIAGDRIRTEPKRPGCEFAALRQKDLPRVLAAMITGESASIRAAFPMELRLRRWRRLRWIHAEHGLELCGRDRIMWLLGNRGGRMNEKPEILPLTGLRGIAACLVVITHYQGWVAPFDYATRPSIFWIFSTADYGMTLFFTLSGYVIAFNYLSLPWQNTPLRSGAWFLWRRFTRLYPALVVFLIWAGFTNQLGTRARGHEVLWTLLHVFSVETWIPAAVGGTLPMGTVYNVSWSISTEIGMYVMFAAVLVLSARAR